MDDEDLLLEELLLVAELLLVFDELIEEDETLLLLLVFFDELIEDDEVLLLLLLIADETLLLTVDELTEDDETLLLLTVDETTELEYVEEVALLVSSSLVVFIELIKSVVLVMIFEDLGLLIQPLNIKAKVAIITVNFLFLFIISHYTYANVIKKDCH